MIVVQIMVAIVQQVRQLVKFLPAFVVFKVFKCLNNYVKDCRYILVPIKKNFNYLPSPSAVVVFLCQLLLIRLFSLRQWIEPIFQRSEYSFSVSET